MKTTKYAEFLQDISCKRILCGTVFGSFLLFVSLLAAALH